MTGRQTGITTMLGVVNERSDFRRASLVSEIYSETQQQSAGPVVRPGGGNKDGKGKPPSAAAPKVPTPYIPGMRRAVPKGKFGLIGLGKTQFTTLISLESKCSMYQKFIWKRNIKCWACCQTKGQL